MVIFTVKEEKENCKPASKHSFAVQKNKKDEEEATDSIKLVD